MREYLQKFFVYQDQLFWNKDIDDTDRRIDMWLKSDECKELIIKNEDLKYIKEAISYLIDNGEFNNMETAYNSSMNSLSIIDDAIESLLNANHQSKFEMIVKCKNEAIREDGSKIMNFTKGKEYKVVNKYEECYLIEDDNGKEEKFFNLKTMFETLKKCSR